MAVTSAQVSVTTSATALNTADTANWTRMSISVPTGGQIVFLGPSTVTSSNGYGVAVGTSKDFLIPPGQVLYGIVPATTQITHVLRLS